MSITHMTMGLLGISLAALGAGTASGETYPTRPIRILATEAGGGADIAARLIAQELVGPMGQPVIVENRATYVAAEIVARARPDGYSLLLAGGSLWLLPFMRDNVPSEKDYAPITLAYDAPQVLVVNQTLPVKSVKDLIALAKAKPGELNYSSSVAGGGTHLAAELFNSMAGVKITRIAYKSTGASLIALMAGEAQLSFPSAGGATPLMKAGKVRGLAVSSAQPSALVPDLPTVIASGLPGFVLTSPTGIFAPAKTPTAIVRKLNQEIVRALSGTVARDRLLSIAVEASTSSPEQFSALIKQDIARLSKVIKDGGIRAD